MKLIPSLLALPILLVSATLLAAPPEGRPPGGPGGGAGGPAGPGGPGAGGPGGPGGHQMPPVMMALDADHDGVISASEIANATAALKTLDKNGDGQLTMEEMRPPHGPGGPGAEGGPQGKRGPGGPGAEGGPQGRHRPGGSDEQRPQPPAQ